MTKRKAEREEAPARRGHDLTDEERARGRAALQGGATLPAGRRIWTRAEAEAQERDVETLLAGATTDAQVISALRQRHQVGAVRTKSLMARVRARWAREDEERSSSNRSEAIRRAKRMLRQVLERLNPPDPKHAPSTGDLVRLHSTAHKWETHLADLQGTKAPLRLELDLQVSQAILQVIATMDADEVAEELAQQRALEQQAAAFRASLPAASVNGTGRH